jgi:hypothetical protein
VADKKHYVAFPKGRKPTRAEALEIGRKLFDSITTEQADAARKDEKKPKK